MVLRIYKMCAHIAGLTAAFRLGLRDGITQGVINSGMSYECDQHQLCWDLGANLGEWIHRRIHK